ncbi:MAG TPA: hypothetical protein VFK05_29175 [Polyangiaceae bacterium]|nr:hypothetical protein [Polyangiaceae bacterium]
MHEIPYVRRYLVLSAFWPWAVGCGFDSDLLSHSGGSAAPASSGVTLSGAGARDEGAGGSYSAVSRITDIENPNTSTPPATGGTFADTDSGGAFAASAGHLGGSVSRATGTAGADDTADSAGTSAAAGSESAVAKTPPPLWFSEYVEGSSSNKALEIAALAHSELEGCKVSTYFNGKLEATVVATLSGVLEAGQVLTLCTSALKEKLPDTCTQVGNLTFNGDDALALSCDGAILDVIGQLGVDPGTAWGSEPNSTVDHTLRRNCSVQSGDPLGDDDFDPSAEWQAFPVDTFDGLGTLGC